MCLLAGERSARQCAWKEHDNGKDETNTGGEGEGPGQSTPTVG